VNRQEQEAEELEIDSVLRGCCSTPGFSEEEIKKG
jgi:hypothetical protein